MCKALLSINYPHESMSRKYYTYAIRDPDTNYVVYVGQTSSINNRRRSHLTLRPRPKIRSINIETWLHDKLSIGKEPVIEILETCDGKRLSLESETKWIETFHARGEGRFLLNKWRVHKKILGKLNSQPWREEQIANHGKPWDEAENARLQRLHEERLPISDIAYHLGRSERAVHMQLARRGFIASE